MQDREYVVIGCASDIANLKNEICKDDGSKPEIRQAVTSHPIRFVTYDEKWEHDQFPVTNDGTWFVCFLASREIKSSSVRGQVQRILSQQFISHVDYADMLRRAKFARGGEIAASMSPFIIQELLSLVGTPSVVVRAPAEHVFHQIPVGGLCRQNAGLVPRRGSPSLFGSGRGGPQLEPNCSRR